MNGIDIRKTLSMKDICGYRCRKAEVRFPGKNDKVYEIWYTDEIKVKDPNAATPFNDIDGILMSFFFIMGPVEMHFEAENVFRKEVPDKTFERRENFLKVTKADINRFIIKIIDL
jgi:hypothetical protein